MGTFFSLYGKDASLALVERALTEVSATKVAKTMASTLEWDVTNLKLQKMLYHAHVLYYGRTGKKLVREPFEAWDYGPVSPLVYDYLKRFGSDPIKDVFPGTILGKDSDEYRILEETAEHLKGLTTGQLVSATHHKDGAWAKHHKPGVKGAKIADESILREYNTLYKDKKSDE